MGRAAIIVAFIIATALAGCGGGGSLKVLSVRVSPDTVNTTVGAQVTFVVYAIMSDNTQRQVTTGITWASSDTGVGTVANGVFTAVAPGTTQVSATVEGVMGVAQVTVLGG